MLDMIFIMGVMLSTAGLVGAPFTHRRRSCREEDTSASPSAGVLPGACRSCGVELPRDEPCCPSCAQEHREREEKHVVRPLI